MAAPTYSNYLKKQGSQIKNLQILLGYYGELYQFYSDKLPNNKYITLLEENLFKDGFSTMNPSVFDFIELLPQQLSLLKAYVRFYRVFNLKNGGTKEVEIPFENKTDLTSIQDPQGYIGTPFPFASERFNGPVALLNSINIREGGQSGRGTTAKNLDWATVDMTVQLQDAKLLFKNFGTNKYPVFYKDFFGGQTTSESRGITGSYLKLELGYNVPDNVSAELKRIASVKTCYKLFPTGVASNLSYEESGGLAFSVSLGARFEIFNGDINILDPKYYKQVKKANNMLVLEDDKKLTEQSLDDTIDNFSLVNNKTNVNKKVESSENSLIANKEEIDQQRIKTQLAASTGAVLNVFSFLAALYEAGLIYYFEIDNDTYKNYIQKISKGEPVDVSTVSFLPKRKKKTKLDPLDSLNKNPNKESYFANTLNVKQFNTDDDEPTSYERIKFFYFGDLVNIMLNNAQGTGVGQDLDRLGGEKEFSYLFGNIAWIKNAKTKVIYNILNTPISLDMFTFFLNREIYQRNRQRMTLNEFFSVFMKKYFDVAVLSYEKSVSGEFQQAYVGKVSYILDADKFTGANTKFIKKISNFIPTSDTRDLITAKFVAALPIEVKKSISKSKQNIPKIYIGGADRGPIKNVNFQLSTQPKKAAREMARRYNGRVASKKSIDDDPLSLSFITTYISSVNMNMIGNPFFKLADSFFVDTRFVDGGFFQRTESEIFITGYYKITSVSHVFDGPSGLWHTSINGEFISTPEENDSYNSFSGELPSLQGVDIASAANINRQGTIDFDNERSNVDKKIETSNSSGALSKKTNESSNAEPVSVPKDK